MVRLDGVLTAKKDAFLPKHAYLEIPNIQVMKAMQSLKSRGYVTEVFSWQWFYWRLTDAGIDYLKSYLHLDDDVLPNTHKKNIPAEGANRFEERGGGRFNRGDDNRERDGYRGPRGRSFRRGGMSRDSRRENEEQ